MAEHFYIGPIKSGLQKNVKPFAIAEDAYERLRNAYLFRGRVRKRFGTRFVTTVNDPLADRGQLTSRLRVCIGVTNGVGTFVGSVPLTGGTPVADPAVGQMFSVGSVMATVVAVGAPLSNLIRTDSNAASTFNFVTGAVNLPVTGFNNTNVYYYPSTSVMGFTEYELSAVNNEQTIAFDQNWAYYLGNTGWEVLGNPAVDFWDGTNSDFFWAASWRNVDAGSNVLFVTNSSIAANNPMRYWDGAAWAVFNPIYAGAFTITSARIIVPFKNRLVLLNTFENGVRHANRCRFSWVGNVIGADLANAFLETTTGRGNWEDVPVQEAIVTAQFIRDRLIVFCERSTWELLPTGNDLRPFVFQQINTSLGAESTFSQIPMDEVVIGVGNVGIHACDGNSVKRIDDAIYEDVYKIHNLHDGPKRVSGIRDYYLEMAYWTFPSDDRTTANPWPDRILCYNYHDTAFSYIDDSFTTFGYIQFPRNTKIWGTDHQLWSEDTSTWETPSLQALTRTVIAGNQEGFTLAIDHEKTSNEECLQITNVTDIGVAWQLTIINHNIKLDEYVLVKHCLFYDGAHIINNFINEFIYRVVFVTDENNIVLENYPANPYVPFAGQYVYIGAGTVTRISRMDILTKQFNFYGQQGNNLAINKIDFLVDTTDFGGVAMDFLVSTADDSISMMDDAFNTGALLGSNVLETSPDPAIPFEAQQDQVWHSMYPQAEGQFIQIRLYHSDLQLLSFQSHLNDFQLHAMIFKSTKITRF